MTLAERLRALIERLEDIGPSEVRWTNAEQFEDVTHGLKALADEAEGKVLVKPEVVDYGDGKYKAFVSKHWEGFTCDTAAEAVLSLEDVIE